MSTRIAWFLMGVISLVGIATGTVYAVTVYIPTAGAHHHAPSVFCCIGLYCLLALCEMLAAYWLGFCGWAVLQD